MANVTHVKIHVCYVWPQKLNSWEPPSTEEGHCSKDHNQERFLIIIKLTSKFNLWGKKIYEKNWFRFLKPQESKIRNYWRPFNYSSESFEQEIQVRNGVCSENSSSVNIVRYQPGSLSNMCDLTRRRRVEQRKRASGTWDQVQQSRHCRMADQVCTLGWLL